MKKIFCIVLLKFSLGIGLLAANPYVVVLGTAQDAGAPQMGCASSFCERAWKDKTLRKSVSSIALVEPDSKRRWIFDATPDLPSQFQFLKETTGDYSNNLDGVFLTHAHIGHYTGLIYLGRESINAKDIKVYAMPRMAAMLENNAPWSQLVSLKNIELHTIGPEKTVSLSDGLAVEAFLVPHRDELSETVGYRIVSGSKSLLFIPDIDKWSKWETKLSDLVAANDFLLIDGTFYQDGEIPRPISEVPHPFVSETILLLKDLPLSERNKVHFIHFNHSNPLVQGNKAKLNELRQAGFGMTFEGTKFRL